MPPAWGVPPMPYALAPQPPRGRTALIVGLALVVAVVLTTGLGAIAGYYYWRTSHITVPLGSFATPTATPYGTVIFQDSLTSDTNGWSTVAPQCQFANGGYQLSDAICYAPIGIIGDASVSVQVRQIQGPSNYPFGLVLRRVAKGNYYAFSIDSDSDWYFGKDINGTFSPIVDWQGSNAINGGLTVTNTLLVHAHGAHFDFFVNGVKIGQADDSTYASGRVGVGTGQNVQAVFNNFKITEP
jgi:hypothetical protein